MKNLSPCEYDVATMPSIILIENKDSLMGPKISSTFPIWVLFCRYIGALKKGIFSFVSLVTASPSHA